MKVNTIKSWLVAGSLMAGALLMAGCQKELLPVDDRNETEMLKKGGGGVESVGNNLSFPVIWAEGYPMTLRTPPVGTSVVLNGAWWYVWGVDPIDPNAPIYSCAPNPADQSKCLDGSTPGDGVSTVYKAWLQKDAGNIWQAYNAPAAGPVLVEFVDWGDNLESSDWYLTSKVRTEVVLYENMPEPVLQYPMRHVSGWGVDEVHGLQTDLNGNVATIEGLGTQATVYTRCARFTIQKLAENPATLTWDPTNHKWVGDVNAPIFNKAVFEAGDGPGYYNAEVNVKGKIIYGYTWDLRKLNDGAGVYRLTFSFDASADGNDLNTFLTNAQILLPVVVPEVVAEAEEGGGVAVIDAANNLTYIDVKVTARGGGGRR
jgi:hypothetical protein